MLLVFRLHSVHLPLKVYSTCFVAVKSLKLIRVLNSHLFSYRLRKCYVDIVFDRFRQTESGKRRVVNKENLLLRGCALRNTDYIEGVVIYAGNSQTASLPAALCTLCIYTCILLDLMVSFSLRANFLAPGTCQRHSSLSNHCFK